MNENIIGRDDPIPFSKYVIVTNKVSLEQAQFWYDRLVENQSVAVIQKLSIGKFQVIREAILSEDEKFINI